MARNSLREAIKMLQALGIVEIRQGSGTYFRHLSFDPLVDMIGFRATLSLRHDGSEARELLDLREAFETGLLPRTIERIRPDDIERLGEAVRGMEEATSPEDRMGHDAAFHQALHGPLANRMLSALMAALWRINTELLLDAVDPAESRVTAEAHRRIYQAVVDKDVKAAIIAMKIHFDPLRNALEARTR